MKKRNLIFVLILCFIALSTKSQSIIKPSDYVDSLYQKPVHQTSFQDPEAPKFKFVSSDTNFIMGIGGFFRFVGGVDFDGLINDIDFRTYDIPVYHQDLVHERFGLSAASSRLFTKLMKRTKKGPIITYIEGDFRGSSNHFRLRQAYLSYLGFTIGQTWSTFMDLTAGPPTVDFEGPNSMIAIRQPQIRYERPFGNHWKMAMALEYSLISGIYDSTIQELARRAPDIPIRIQYYGNWGHIQMAGIARDFIYKSDMSGSTKESMGWGFSLTSKIHFGQHTDFFFQGTYGEGIAAYVQDLAGVGLDFTVADTGKSSLVPVYGGYISIQQYLNRKHSLFTTLVAGFTETGDLSNLSASQYKTGYYLAANVFWNMMDDMLFGMEYNWGKRVNIDQASGEANRINFCLQYNF